MSVPTEPDGRNSRPRRLAKPITVKRLENVAAAYVARYDASSARLRTVLMRRIDRARNHDMPVVDNAEAVIASILARYTKAGVIDDARYAERKAGSLHRRGTSSRHIREKLKLAGIDRDDVERALDVARDELAVDATGMDLQAALAFARRRRLGPFRDPADRDERRSRDLAALGRAGFSFDVARRVIDTDDPDALGRDGP